MADTTRILFNFGNAFFLASGCWGDLLLIRIFLSTAYCFMIANEFIFEQTNYEMYAWAFACLYLQGSSAVRLVLDEGPVKLDEKQEHVGCTSTSFIPFNHYNTHAHKYSSWY